MKCNKCNGIMENVCTINTTYYAPTTEPNMTQDIFKCLSCGNETITTNPSEG